MDKEHSIPPSLTLNEELPDWSLGLIFDDVIPRKEDFSGKPLLLLFFSLDCLGCLGRAIPYANRVVFENINKINVIGIHASFNGLENTKQEFVKAKEDLFIRFPIYKDYQSNTTLKRFGALGFPHWILVDNNGKVVYSLFGSDPNKALMKLDYLINELI